MDLFWALTVAGIATYGCVYALTAMGIVVTYTTSGIFNFAQGAMGMMGAFLYWQLLTSGWPSWAAFVFVVLVVAPLFGGLIERVLMRRVAAARLEAKLTVTVGLLLFLIAVAQWVWDPTVGRTVPQFFNGRSVSVGGVALTYHQLAVVAVAILVAILMWLFFYRTRPGIATRAVVDDRELTSLAGAAPSRYSMLGWAIGTSLASTAGILLAPTVSLDVQSLTLLVINGYAAAMVGRLKNLPLTFAGAIVLGLVQSYAIGYLPYDGTWSTINQIVPMAYLFVVILVLPQTRAAIVGRINSRAPRIPGLRESVLVAAIFVVVAVVVVRLLSDSNVNIATRGVALAIIMLSLVPLTGYGGQVSLAQLTFAGVGAYVMDKVGGNSGSPWGLLAAVGVTAAIGAVIAVPTLRLRGLYLALATLAFAYGMDLAFFTNNAYFGSSNALTVQRLHLPGISLSGDRTYFVALCVIFAVAGMGILALRRSLFGRRLIALNDSPAACLTLGVNTTATKLIVFMISAGLAGLGGALYGGAQGVVGPNDFAFLASATLLMTAVIWGVRTIGGMMLGGLFVAIGPQLQSWVTSHWHSGPTNSLQLLVGLAAIGIAQNPEGAFGMSPLAMWRARRAAATDRAPESAAPDLPPRHGAAAPSDASERQISSVTN